MRSTEARTHGKRLVAMTTGILFVVAFASTAAADRTLTNADIRDAIEDEILFDESVPFDAIDVSVEDGIATLTGNVRNLLAKERAVKIARTVKGVRSVVDRLEVQPLERRSDEALRADVTRTLTMDPAADAYEVDVSVHDGIVTLSGTVESWQEKDLAETVAKSVKGVTAIDNQIEVEYDAVRPDYEIQNEIAKALEWDVLVDDGLIDVNVQNGGVNLSGIVGSASEKNRAIRDAWVAGVTDVDASALEVERWARDDDLRKHKYVLKTDEEIMNAVEDALVRDPRVSAFDVATHVDGGVVTLRGKVDYLKAKRAAEDTARNTIGVLRVDNRIKVRPVLETTDAEIRERVEDALVRDSVVEAYEIDVEVTNSRVRLHGEVDSYYEKFHADDVAARVDGVVAVNNNLEVDFDEGPLTVYDPYVDPYYYPYGYTWYDVNEPTVTLRSDATIKQSVEDELWWSPFVDADDVSVSVDDGVVTLTGTVDSWTEVGAAIENAYEGGASRVDNDLVVSTIS